MKKRTLRPSRRVRPAPARIGAHWLWSPARNRAALRGRPGGCVADGDGGLYVRERNGIDDAEDLGWPGGEADGPLVVDASP